MPLDATSDLGENEDLLGRATPGVSHADEESQRPFAEASDSPPPQSVASNYVFVDQPHAQRELSPPLSIRREDTPPPEERRFVIQTESGPRYVHLPVFPVSGEEIVSPLNIEFDPIHLSNVGRQTRVERDVPTYGEATQSTGPVRGAQTTI